MEEPPPLLHLTPGRLICLACARTDDCPPADQRRYLQAREWPLCCGRVMAFCPRTDEPGGSRRADPPGWDGRRPAADHPTGQSVGIPGQVPRLPGPMLPDLS